jgi:ERCC4-type nuclease
MAVSSSSSASTLASTFHLLIDSNEQAHYAKRSIDLCAQLSALSGLPAQVKPLSCGDYALVYATDATHAASDEVPCYALFERKTRADLASSIVDTRYKSQAQRLVDTGVSHICWIITPATLFDSGAELAISSAIVHLSFGYPNTCVLQLNDSALDVFAHTLRKAAEYLSVDSYGTYAVSMREVQTKGAKPRFETQQEVYLEQLCVPRGMSLRKARAVAVRAPSMHKLFELWRRAVPSGDKMEADALAARGKRACRCGGGAPSSPWHYTTGNCDE